jgi:hypothetical protein
MYGVLAVLYKPSAPSTFFLRYYTIGVLPKRKDDMSMAVPPIAVNKQAGLLGLTSWLWKLKASLKQASNVYFTKPSKPIVGGLLRRLSRLSCIDKAVELNVQAIL